MKRRLAGVCAAVAAATACSSASSPAAPTTPLSETSATVRLRADVWADNWFAAYVGETKVAEDTVPITTERSFNAETFFINVSYPFQLNLVIRDYIQDDSGLEYIGTSNQQMGDGGFIMQLTDTATGRVVAVSDATLRCLVIHKAPLNPSCEKSPSPSTGCLSQVSAEPAGWKLAGFDASSWQPATIFTAAQVGPKEGYNTIRWDASARLVWTSDLKADNTLLCTRPVDGR